MAWVTVDEYITRYYAPESRPKKTTVWRWIRNGQLPAVKRGKRWWIDLTKIEHSTGNPRADRILNKG